MARTDPQRARDAYDAGHTVLRDWLAVLPGDVWSIPSVLPGWTVADLVAHVVLVTRSVAGLEPAPADSRPRTPLEYMGGYASAAGEIADASRDVSAAAAHEPAALLDDLDRHYAAAAQVLDALVPQDPVVRARRAPIRLGDYLATRVVELAVHADDLARSVPGLEEPTMPREVQRLAVRTLLDALAERAPGRSVEVRVPPFAAVQCVEGPRHSRGTPSNLVEADATTWLRLATGRMTWSDAIDEGQLSASGGRADLSGYLPLF